MRLKLVASMLQLVSKGKEKEWKYHLPGLLPLLMKHFWNCSLSSVHLLPEQNVENSAPGRQCTDHGIYEALLMCLFFQYTLVVVVVVCQKMLATSCVRNFS